MSAHFERARVLLDQGRHDLARREYQKALQEDPEMTDAHAGLAFCFFQLGNLNDAIREAQEALRISANCATAHTVLALCYRDTLVVDKAITEIGESIKFEPDVPWHYWVKSSILFKTKSWAEARDAVEQGLTHNPNDTNCLNGASSVYIELGDLNKAKELASRSLSVDPECGETHHLLGRIQMLEGDHDAALASFQEALRLNPNLSTARISAATIIGRNNRLAGWIFKTITLKAESWKSLAGCVSLSFIAATIVSMIISPGLIQFLPWVIVLLLSSVFSKVLQRLMMLLGTFALSFNTPARKLFTPKEIKASYLAMAGFFLMVLYPVLGAFLEQSIFYWAALCLPIAIMNVSALFSDQNTRGLNVLMLNGFRISQVTAIVVAPVGLSYLGLGNAFPIDSTSMWHCYCAFWIFQIAFIAIFVLLGMATSRGKNKA